MSSDWTPEEVADIKNVIAIVASAVIDGDDITSAQGRIDRCLVDVDGARRVATDAVNLCGLLLEHIVQTEQKTRNSSESCSVLCRKCEKSRMRTLNRCPMPRCPGSTFLHADPQIRFREPYQAIGANPRSQSTGHLATSRHADVIPSVALVGLEFDARLDSGISAPWTNSTNAHVLARGANDDARRQRAFDPSGAASGGCKLSFAIALVRSFRHFNQRLTNLPVFLERLRRLPFAMFEILSGSVFEGPRHFTFGDRHTRRR